MQEHHVTVSGRILPLPEPFFVLATQNPIEQEGTYALPEAQLDRFMFFVEVQYPDRDEELRIARETTGAASQPSSPKSTASRFSSIRNWSNACRCQTIFTTSRWTSCVPRDPPPTTRRTSAKNSVSWGAGPRAIQYLIRGAKARAVLHGSYLVRQEDLEAVAHPVLRHRIITNFQAQAEGTDSTVIVEKLLDQFRDASA